MPFALLTAAFIAQIAPVEDLAYIVGPDSGLLGIIISAILGGLLPGGPMTSFPIALIFFAGGAGAPQIVAFISGWSIFEAIIKVSKWIFYIIFRTIQSSPAYAKMDINII